MDVSALVQMGRAAREYEQEIGALRIRLRLPSQFEAASCMRLAVERERAECRAREVPASVDLAAHYFLRWQLEAGVVGWSGVTAEDLAPGGGADAVAWEPAAVPLLLDNRPDVAEALGIEFMRRFAERRTRTEASAGN